MERLKVKIHQLAKEQLGQNIAVRRHLHQYPELSFEEYETSKYVAEQLRSMGIVPQTEVAGTGLVAEIKGKHPESKTIALRADMDALPIKEANDVPYKSKNAGVMHACGHDVHTSSLLGVARILSEVNDEFEGTVRLIFQPGEERVPGGASQMIKAGALDNPRPKSILGQHVMPLIPVGKVGFREGMYMASADEIYLKVVGKGGHAAMPESFIDPIYVASQMVVSLQHVVSRFMNPKVPAVLSFGRFIGEGVNNVIPNEVEVHGTFRTMDEEWREKALQRIEQVALLTAEMNGAKCEVEIRRGYPFLKNDPALARRCKRAAQSFLGNENVVDLDLWMAAEDFSYYTHHMDGCFYRLGTRNEEKGITSGVHTPTFDIDENALEVGTGLMAWLAVSELVSGL